MKNPFRKLGVMFGKGRKSSEQTNASSPDTVFPDTCATGGSHEQLDEPSSDVCQTRNVASVPIVVVPDGEPEGRTEARETDNASVSSLRTPGLLTRTASPTHSESYMQLEEGSGAMAVQEETATPTSSDDCQELTALNTCGDLERVVDANRGVPATLRSEIDNIRIELLWRYPPFYDFCVIASDDDYNLSVQFRRYLARTYQLIGCTLYDGFITLGADLFDCYEVMMDHSHKAFFLVTENFSQNAFCRRLQSGAVFQCLMSKVKKDREKCVPVYPYGICRAPLALSGVAGLLPAQKEMMKRVLLNTYLPDVRKRRAMLDHAHYEQRCIEFKKRVNLCIEAYHTKNALESSMPLLQVENVSQNSLVSQGSGSEILPTYGNSMVSSDPSASDMLINRSLLPVPSVSDMSNQNSTAPSTLKTSNENFLANAISNMSDQRSSLEVNQLQISDSDEEIRKTLKQLKEMGSEEFHKQSSGKEESILVNSNARNTCDLVRNETCQGAPLDREKKRKERQLPEPADDSVSNENVKTKQPQKLSSDKMELRRSVSHDNTSDNSDNTDGEHEKEESENDSDNNTSDLSKKICEALKSTNIGNSPGTTVVNIEGSTGTVTVGPSITVVVNFAQNEKKRSPRHQSPRRPSSDSD